MKKMIQLMVVGLLVLAATGCAMFGGSDASAMSPYKAGRMFVFIDVVTEPIQPAEVKAVVSQVYGLASINVLSDATDDLVRQQIANAYPDATPEFRAVVFNLYKNLTIKLLSEIDVNADLPKTEVISEFNRGIVDALALYQPKEE